MNKTLKSGYSIFTDSSLSLTANLFLSIKENLKQLLNPILH